VVSGDVEGIKGQPSEVPEVLDRILDVMGLSELPGANYKSGCDVKEKVDSMERKSSPGNRRKEGHFSTVYNALVKVFLLL